MSKFRILLALVAAALIAALLGGDLRLTPPSPAPTAGSPLPTSRMAGPTTSSR